MKLTEEQIKKYVYNITIWIGKHDHYTFSFTSWWRRFLFKLTLPKTTRIFRCWRQNERH